MAAPDDLLPVLGIPAAHLVPLGVLAVYLAVVVLLLKRALDAVTAAAPPPCTSSSSPSSHDKDDARRNDRWWWVFTAIAAGSLLHTWTHMLRYMAWSCQNFSRALPQDGPTPAALLVVGEWLRETSLFEEAWAIVLRPGVSAWISEHITHYTITFWVLLLWVYTRPEGGAVGWRAQSWGRPAAALFLALGQLVAISVASALFFAGCARRGLGRAAVDRVRVPVGVWAPLLVSSTLSALVPLTTDQPTFLPNLLFFHVLLFAPFLPLAQRPALTLSLRTTLLLLLVPTVPSVLHATPSIPAVWQAYRDGNDALRSIGADALWAFAGVAAWTAYKGRGGPPLGPLGYWLTGSPLGFGLDL